MLVREKILVVEDEFLIAQDIKQILEKEDYQVFINYNNVDVAIRAISELNPNLVLIDINLKQSKDGIDLAKYLLGNDRVPFVFISSYADDLTFERAKDTRPHAFIVKPFNDVVLKTTIKLVLNNFKLRKIDPLREIEVDLRDDTPFRIRKSIQYIDDNINERIEIEDLAKITNWKKHHFIRQFYKYTGMTPYQYILKNKIIKSIAMIKETNMSLVEISYEIGFSSYTNFYNSFKKITNQTPENFRKKSMVANNYLN